MVSDTLMPGLHFYQSANADTAIIKDNFVVRTHEYDIIIDDIRNNPMNGSVQHYLLLGRRGSGKSTLLKRLQIEIDTDAELQRTHVAINLAEEQANIYRLYDLLEEIIQELEYRNIEVEKPDWDADENSFSRKLFDAIHAAIEKTGKKVVLLLDNIDRIFENLKKDAGLLREMLLNYSDIKIIGGSTRMTEHFWKYNQPFYQFFRVLEMKPLTSAEIKKLLLHWSEKLDLPILKEFVEKRTGQLETIRILTDGLPRTLQFFLNILIKRTHETGYEYLRLIMDQVTPLYQERLNNLPPSQRKIVLQMAFIWEAAGAKEIADATRMDNKLISAQLKQLIEKGIAEKIETKTKNHLYRLSERFFNLWLIFTQGSPTEKRKARYLTLFLENFYDKENLQSQVRIHLELVKDKKLSPNTAALLTKAYAQSKYISKDLRNELIEQTNQILNIDNELRKQLPLPTYKIYPDVLELIEKEKWNDALKEVFTIEQNDGLKDLFIAHIYTRQNNLNLAEKHYLLAIEQGRDAIAYYSLGSVYQVQRKYNLAEQNYFLAIAKGNYDGLLGLAKLYNEESKFNLSEKYFLCAIKKEVLGALHDIGMYYKEHSKFKLAEKYFKLSIEKGFDFSVIALAHYYYEKNYKKREALELIRKSAFDFDSELRIVLLITIKFWNGLIKEGYEDLIIIIQERKYKYLSQAFFSAFVHHQTNIVIKLFTNSNFAKDLVLNFPLIAYAGLFLNDKDNTGLKIPPEFRETVDIILKEVKEKQIFYYGSSQIK